MMTLPSASQLIEVIRAELRDVVAPAAPEAADSLAIIDGLLESLATRSEHEIAWMLEEIASIEELAGTPLDPPESLQLASVRERYHEASAILADLIEPALAAGGERRSAIEAIVDARVAREAEIRGAIALVGRG